MHHYRKYAKKELYFPVQFLISAHHQTAKTSSTGKRSARCDGYRG